MLERQERESSRAVYQEGGPLVRPENPQPWMSLPMFLAAPTKFEAELPTSEMYILVARDAP